MDFELEVFEIYDEGKSRPKHTRKKCKQKRAVGAPEWSEREPSRSSRSSVLSGDRRPISLRQSIIGVFSKLVVWRDQRRYQTSLPDKVDSPHTSRDPRRGFLSIGESPKKTDIQLRRCLTTTEELTGILLQQGLRSNLQAIKIEFINMIATRKGAIFFFKEWFISCCCCAYKCTQIFKRNILSTVNFSIKLQLKNMLYFVVLELRKQSCLKLSHFTKISLGPYFSQDFLYNQTFLRNKFSPKQCPNLH